MPVTSILRSSALVAFALLCGCGVNGLSPQPSATDSVAPAAVPILPSEVNLSFFVGSVPLNIVATRIAENYGTAEMTTLASGFRWTARSYGPSMRFLTSIRFAGLENCVVNMRAWLEWMASDSSRNDLLYKISRGAQFTAFSQKRMGFILNFFSRSDELDFEACGTIITARFDQRPLAP